MTRSSASSGIFEKKWEAFWSTVSGEEAGKKVPLIPEAVEALKLFNADMSKGGPRKLLGRSGVPKGLTHGDARVENMIWRNLKSGGTPGATGAAGGRLGPEGVRA